MVVQITIKRKKKLVFTDFLRQKWINACKRVNKDGAPWNSQGKSCYICGKHFKSGKSSK